MTDGSSFSFLFQQNSYEPLQFDGKLFSGEMNKMKLISNIFFASLNTVMCQILESTTITKPCELVSTSGSSSFMTAVDVTNASI